MPTAKQIHESPRKGVKRGGGLVQAHMCRRQAVKAGSDQNLMVKYTTIALQGPFARIAAVFRHAVQCTRHMHVVE